MLNCKIGDKEFNIDIDAIKNKDFMLYKQYKFNPNEIIKINRDPKLFETLILPFAKEEWIPIFNFDMDSLENINTELDFYFPSRNILKPIDSYSTYISKNVIDRLKFELDMKSLEFDKEWFIVKMGLFDISYIEKPDVLYGTYLDLKPKYCNNQKNVEISIEKLEYKGNKDKKCKKIILLNKDIDKNLYETIDINYKFVLIHKNEQNYRIRIDSADIDSDSDDMEDFFDKHIGNENTSLSRHEMKRMTIKSKIEKYIVSLLEQNRGINIFCENMQDIECLQIINISILCAKLK